MFNRFVFIGPNGSGKSTQAKAIAKAFDLSYVSAGDLLRREVDAKTPFGLEYAEGLKNGLLAPIQVTNDLLLKEIKTFPIDRGYIIDGFPRTQAQLDFLIENIQIDACVYMTIENVQEIVNRSLLRGRCDDTEDVIKSRLEIYRNSCQPILDYFASKGNLLTVDASGSIDAVYALATSKMGLCAVSA